MKSTYYVGSTPFSTRDAAVKRAKQYANEDGTPVTVTVEREKTDRYTKTRGRVLGFSVGSLLPSKQFEVKPDKQKANPRGRIVVKGVEYDKGQNRTWISVETPQFSKRYYVSGYVPKSKALGFVRARVERELKEFNPGKAKRNPASQASEAYTDFHGRASEEVVTVKTEIHYHKHLAACGELRKLVIKPVGKLFTVSLSGFKKALLAFNEKRTQLFIEGGDQAVDLRQFGIKAPHETETLGEVRVIEYFTIKDHLGNEGGKAVYVHKFHKPYPVLIYNVLDQQLTFSGGSYKVLAEGIDK
jgi:hypothetical protein